ncbi:nucleolar protein dao-5-like isoform X3 [Daphnia pulex]|nr:nucleolar protein dao-5-like isoform X3 [Daphnia pulex]
MELGHLILKGEDLLDCKKNCRLLGAIVSKLESRHNGTQNIQAAVRKIRLLKPKTASEKNLHKQTSSASSGEEEPVKPELVVPHKGRELPRTPPSRPGSDAGASEFVKPKLPPSPLAAHQIPFSKPAKIVSTTKGFRPILPTKEIPRTPLKSPSVPTPVDTCFPGHNLTVDFSSARLTSSNTSTPYDHHKSRNQSSSGEGDATFVIPSKRGAMVNCGKVDEMNSESDEDVFENSNEMEGTYVKETKPGKPASVIDESTWVLGETNKSETEKVAPTEMLPGLHNTFALPKKNAGKSQKVNKGKTSPEVEDDVKTAPVEKETPETVETNGDVIDTVAAKGKKGRGKKPGKKEVVEENHLNGVETESPVAEVESEESSPVVETNVKKGRGKKAAAVKKGAVEEISISTGPEVPETEVKKGRNKKPSKKETIEENQEEQVVEKHLPAEVEAAAPVAETKEKRGRGKKAQPPVAKSEEMSSSPEVNPEPVEETAQEKAVKVVAEPKSKPGPKSKTGPKSKMETKPTEAESETTQVVEPEVVEKKGRGKRGNQVPDTAPPTATEVDTDQPEVQAPLVVAAATEVSPAPEVKKGRGKVKATVEEVPEPKESENLVTNEPDTKEKRGRGRQASSKDGTEKAAKASEEPLPNDETESPLPASPVAETKEKQGRGRQAKAQAEAPVEETTEAAEVVTAKRGRGKKAAAPAASKADAEEEAVEEVKETKPKGKKGAAAAKKHVEEEEKPAVPEEPVASKVDAEEEAVEEVKEAKAKGKKGAAAAKKHVEEEEKPAVPEEPAAPVKTVVESPETSKAVPAKRGRGKKATPLAKVADESDEEAEAVEEVKETKPKGKKGAAAAKKQVEEEEKPAVPEEPAAPVKTVVETPETLKAVPAKRGRGKKATPLAKVADESDEEAEAVEEVKETKAKGKKGPAAKKQAEEKVAAVPEATTEKTQKTTKRGKAAVATPDESEASPPKKPKGAPLETEGVRKSSRTQVVKTYADESSESLDQPASKKRGGRKKAAANAINAVAEEAEDNKKKPTKKKAASESPEPKPEPPKVEKVAANKRGTKREQPEEAEAALPPAAEEKKRGAKKDDKAPELPLRVVNGLEEDSETNSSKRSKTSEDAEAAAEEPEKKAGRGRKKKEEPQPVETENKSPDDGKKKGKRGGKEEIAEVEKKKPVGRKKAAAAAAVAVVQEEEPEAVASPVQTKQRGKRGAAQAADFVTVISGQNSTDPSPKGSPVVKVRRLKLVEEKQAQAESDEEEVTVPVAATKRTYTRRNK